MYSLSQNKILSLLVSSCYGIDKTLSLTRWQLCSTLLCSLLVHVAQIWLKCQWQCFRGAMVCTFSMNNGKSHWYCWLDCEIVCGHSLGLGKCPIKLEVGSVFLSSPAGWLPSGTLSHNLVLCLLPHKLLFLICFFYFHDFYKYYGKFIMQFYFSRLCEFIRCLYHWLIETFSTRTYQCNIYFNKFAYSYIRAG